MVSDDPARVPSASRGAPSRDRQADRVDPAGPPGDRVGDEDDPAVGLAAEGDVEGGGVDVDAVGDERHRDPVVGEDGPDHPRLAVVQRRHGVEAVGDQPGAGVDGGAGLGQRRRRVADRHDRPPAGQGADGRDGPVDLGPQGHQPDGAGQGRQPLRVGRADQGTGVGAVGPAEEGALEVGAGDPGPGRGAVGRRRDPVDPGPVGLQRCGDQGREPGRRALGGEEGVEAVPVGGGGGGGHVDVVDPVDLEVDEPGGQDAIGHRPGGRHDRGDAAVVDLDQSRTQHPHGRHHLRRGEDGHGAGQYRAGTLTLVSADGGQSSGDRGGW